MAIGLKNICNKVVFENIFNKYGKDIKRFVFFKTQDADLTDDILQETFIKLWDHCGKVDFAKVKSYLYMVANNTFLNHIKHEKVVRTHQAQTGTYVSHETPEFVFIEKEFLNKIETTIASLPDKQREVFLLNRIEKMKYKEIAVQLNISVKTVEKRMHGALLVMRKKIGNV